MVEKKTTCNETVGNKEFIALVTDRFKKANLPLLYTWIEPIYLGRITVDTSTFNLRMMFDGKMLGLKYSRSGPGTYSVYEYEPVDPEREFDRISKVLKDLHIDINSMHVGSYSVLSDHEIEYVAVVKRPGYLVERFWLSKKTGKPVI